MLLLATHSSILLSVIYFLSFVSQDFLGKSDPYLEFAKENPDGSYTTTHRTQVPFYTIPYHTIPHFGSDVVVCIGLHRYQLILRSLHWPAKALGLSIPSEASLPIIVTF